MTAREGESALSGKKFVDCDGKWRILLQSVALWTAQHTFADSTMFFTSISGLKDFCQYTYCFLGSFEIVSTLRT